MSVAPAAPRVDQRDHPGGQRLQVAPSARMRARGKRRRSSPCSGPGRSPKNTAQTPRAVAAISAWPSEQGDTVTRSSSPSPPRRSSVADMPSAPGPLDS